MNTPSTSKVPDEIVLDSDTDLDDDEVVEVSDDSSSSDETPEIKKEEENIEEKGEGSESESDEDEDEDEEEGGGSESESIESEGEDEEMDEEDDDGTDSVFSFDGENVIQPSQEANEAAVMKLFNAGLDDMLAGKKEAAKEAFEKLLENDNVACFRRENIDWETEQDENLSRMARVFIGCHKNLIQLDLNNRIDHLVQILALSPKQNHSLWEALGEASYNLGDLSLAKFSFSKMDNYIGDCTVVFVMYIMEEFHGCLELIKELLDQRVEEDILYYLKEEIRNKGVYFRQVHDDLFQEDRDFGHEVYIPSEERKKELKGKVEDGQRKYCLSRMNTGEKREEKEEISLHIPPFSLNSLFTLFCDLLDRIENYHTLSNITLFFETWDDPQLFDYVNETMEDILTILETAEDLVKKVENEEEQSIGSKDTQTDRRKSVRMIERGQSTPDTIAISISDSLEEPETFLPSNELSTHFNLTCPLFSPLLQSKRPSRSPTPVGSNVNLKETFVHSLIRQRMVGKKMDIHHSIKTVLLLLTDICPTIGSLPEDLHASVIQLYRRLNRMYSDMNAEEFLKIHVMMDDLRDEQGRDYVERWHYGQHDWPDRNLALRYIWNCARYYTRENRKLELLDYLFNCLDENDLICTATGFFSLYDVSKLKEKVAKVERIRSIKLYGETEMHEEVVKIMSCDMDLSSLEPTEIPLMLNYWFDALFAIKQFDDAAELIGRIVMQYLYEDEFDEFLPKILEWSERIETSSLSESSLSSFGFILTHIVQRNKKSWRWWRRLYDVIRAIEGPVSAAYISTLNSSSHDDAMPLLSLELLVKAHEALSTDGSCCKYNNGEFLIFSLQEMAKIYDDQKLTEILLRKENAWILCNMDEEIGQCLHCAFGRFSKRRKQVYEHFSRPGVTPSPELAPAVLTLAIPRPLPLFEDKERLGHDVPELIMAKFPHFIEVSKKRMKQVDEFEEWLRERKKEDVFKKSFIWPTVSEPENQLQSSVWYLMALHSYRQNAISENLLYCQLFLTSGYATYTNRVTTSAWGMLAHSAISEFFKLDEEMMFKEWEFRTMTYRIGIHIDDSLGILHFQLANCLYQTATIFKRYIRRLPANRHKQHLVKSLRAEAHKHFEICVQIPPVDNKVEEFQWLSFFFLAKLYAKGPDVDYVKVVDNFFEAACSCELGDFFWYPLKLNIKKQGNLEPVELHYQLYNAIWKYLKTNELWEMEENVLVKLLSYARAFRNHKVVKSSNSLFQSNPEITEIVLRMSVEADKGQIAGEEWQVLSSTLNILDLVDELWNMCNRAFELVIERFPHNKAAYRLAEMELRKKNFTKAHEHLIKGVFRRKKKDEGFFDNCIEISSADITRSGSYEFHIERSTHLLLQLLSAEKDISTLLHLLLSLISSFGETDDFHLSPPVRNKFIEKILVVLQHCFTSTSPKQYTTECIRIWQKIEKYKDVPGMWKISIPFKTMISSSVGDLSRLAAQQTLRDEMAKRPGRKRKVMTDDAIQPKRPVDIPIAPGPAPPPEPPSATIGLTVPSLDIQLFFQKILGTRNV